MDLNDGLSIWNVVFQLANAVITDPDCIPFWHGLIELGDQDDAAGKVTPPFKRQIEPLAAPGRGKEDDAIDEATPSRLMPTCQE